MNSCFHLIVKDTDYWSFMICLRLFHWAFTDSRLVTKPLESLKVILKPILAINFFFAFKGLKDKFKIRKLSYTQQTNKPFTTRLKKHWYFQQMRIGKVPVKIFCKVKHSVWLYKISRNNFIKTYLNNEMHKKVLILC